MASTSGDVESNGMMQRLSKMIQDRQTTYFSEAIDGLRVCVNVNHAHERIHWLLGAVAVTIPCTQASGVAVGGLQAAG